MMEETMDDVKIEKRKTDKENGKDTVFVKTITEFEDFTYIGKYKIEYSLYDMDGEEQWDVEDFEILEKEMQFIPKGSDYKGIWFVSQYENPIIISDLNWETKEIAFIEGEQVREMTGFVEENEGEWQLGMKTSYQGDFEIFLSGERCAHISRDILFSVQEEELYRCVEVRGADGIVIATARDIMSAVGTIVERCQSVQMDFSYEASPVFVPYLEQDIDVYSFDKKIGTITVDDIEPFYTILLTENNCVVDWYERKELYRGNSKETIWMYRFILNIYLSRYQSVWMSMILVSGKIRFLVR